jgi:hypothetical protein
MTDMAENLFEKYGIKEVADVTLYRIERKDETYESQRKISVSSILKGALAREIVYPLDEDGKGEVEGYEAYVFKKADVLTHFNYDCDDVFDVKGSALFVDDGENPITTTKYTEGDDITDPVRAAIVAYLTAGENSSDPYHPHLFFDSNVAILSLSESSSGRNLIDKTGYLFSHGYGVNTIVIGDGSTSGVISAGQHTENKFSGRIVLEVTDTEEHEYIVTIEYTNATIDNATLAIINAAKGGSITTTQATSLITEAKGNADAKVETDETTNPPSGEEMGTINYVNVMVNDETRSPNQFLITFTAKFVAHAELETGIYDLGSGAGGGHFAMDADGELHGTHEFSYAEQICMLFAKNQNLITKAGTRYQFANPDGMFPGFEFDDNFATAPNGKERVVVVGLSGRISENLYDIEEVDAAIKELTATVEAKAYDVVYSDYAELLVEDEMGYYLPQQLGGAYNKRTGAVVFFDQTTTYEDFAAARKGIDLGILGAVNTWGDDTHYSINDAIDALKQEKQLIDSSADSVETGFTRVFGGYKVTGGVSESELPLDDVGRGVQYEDYTLNGVALNDVVGNKLSSLYNLDSVLQALSIADLNGQVDQIRISSTTQMKSNRAIYVNPNNNLITNRANIYLLRNVNVRALSGDKEGVFEFNDKKGNRLYYQDKVFAGTPYLTLITIDAYGLVFVANRHCNKNVEKVAWMINDNGYITDKQAERIVKNGLIHTVDITVCDESFDATCTVGSIKVRKTKKNVLRYVPVLFLDTLKVSTIEQASEKSDATGGHGNSKLITWDYGKEITLSIEDALYTPASMATIWGGETGKSGVKEANVIDRFEKITAKRNFIVPAGNSEGAPSEGNITAQAVYYDPKTMEPFQDGTPIAEGEVIYKLTRSVAYDNNSLGKVIEISADKFPGTYRVVGETLVRDKATGEDQRFQFIIPEAKMSSADTSITLEADGDPVVFSFTMDVLRPENGVMMKFVQFDVVENTEENDGSTMVKDTENLNLLDSAEMYKVSGEEDEEFVIGATEY